MKNALLSIKRKKYRMSFRKLIDDTRFLKFKVTSTNGKTKPKIFPPNNYSYVKSWFYTYWPALCTIVNTFFIIHFYPFEKSHYL